MYQQQLPKSGDKDPYLVLLLTLPFSRLLPLVPLPPLLLPRPCPPPQGISCTKTSSCVLMGNLKLKYLLSNFDLLLQMSVDFLILVNNLIVLFFNRCCQNRGWNQSQVRTISLLYIFDSIWLYFGIILLFYHCHHEQQHLVALQCHHNHHHHHHHDCCRLHNHHHHHHHHQKHH